MLGFLKSVFDERSYSNKKTIDFAGIQNVILKCDCLKGRVTGGTRNPFFCFFY